MRMYYVLPFFFLCLCLVAGCGGGGGGSSSAPIVPTSSWEGQWIGNWNDPATRLSGTMQITIDTHGRITGYLGSANTAFTLAHVVTGTVQENGWTDFYYEYNSGITYPGSYHWTGNFTLTSTIKIEARGQVGGPNGEFWTGNACNLTKQ